jgi:ketosteroid isomerase-like protein
VNRTEEQVRETNAAFYRAFRERDFEAMDAIWARSNAVACLHPGMDVIVGRDKVMRSWRGILSHENAPRLAESRVEVHLVGDGAFVTCLEGVVGDRPALIATNVFVREGDVWRMVHHHAAPLSVSVDTEPTGEPDPPVWN